MQKILRSILFALLLIFPISCTYGPPRINASISNAFPKPESHIFALASSYMIERRPTGLSTFPDGGSIKILLTEARIYICDADSHTSKRVATLPVENGFGPWIEGWDGEYLFFSLSGRAGTSVQDFKKPIKFFYRIGPDSKVSKLDRPPILNSSFLRLLKSGKSIRISKGFATLDIKTESESSFKTLFKLDSTTGELVAI